MTSQHDKLLKAKARKPTTFTVSVSGQCAAGRFLSSNCRLVDYLFMIPTGLAGYESPTRLE